MSLSLTIETLGAKGDGVARPDHGDPLFVPFALPGERVAVERIGSHYAVEEILIASAERQVPPCPHFGVCGGCDLQHADDALYRRFKRDLVVEAFGHAGLAPDIADLVP